MIDGTTKGDGTADVLKVNRWRWSRYLDSWYVPRSRDTAPKWQVINSTAAALREAGFTMQIDVDASYRPTAEVEADKIARQQDRVDALDAKATKFAAAADAAHDRAHELGDRVPLGQPILVDHYSAPKMRKHYDQVQKASDDALAAQRAARRAAGTTDHRYAPTVVARRIAKTYSRTSEGGAESRRLHPHPVHEQADRPKGGRDPCAGRRPPPSRSDPRA